MCVVIDINTLAHVFNPDTPRHTEFVHVGNWIQRGHGFLVFGGTKLKKELKKAFRYLRLIRQMKDSGKAIAIRDDLVDAEEIRIKDLTLNTDCDDQHIIALLGVSRCPLLCSEDARSYPYITKKEYYPKGMARVRIYSSSRNNSLLKRPLSREILKNQA